MRGLKERGSTVQRSRIEKKEEKKKKEEEKNEARRFRIASVIDSYTILRSSTHP